MELTNEKINNKILKFLIEITNSMRNLGNEEGSIVYNKGVIVYENLEKLPQYAYGILNFHTYKKDNKAMSKNEKAINDEVEKVVNDLSLVIGFDNIRELKSGMVGYTCNKIEDDEEYLYVELTEKSKKTDPENKIYGKKYYNFKKWNKDLILPYQDTQRTIDITDEIMSEYNKTINVRFEGVNLKLTHKSIILGGKYNIPRYIRVIEDKGDIMLVDIVSEVLREDEMDFSSSIVTYAEYHNIYRVVKSI